MTELRPVLACLGLGQYHDALVEEGFETWETVLDITETDLVALDFKLGHRRKLQREIADHRGVSAKEGLGQHEREPSVEAPKSGSRSIPVNRSAQPGIQGHGIGETKRKYRRHPKPDENAPERPASAYVIFSNKIREEVRFQKLSFTDIAKLVGEKWQMLSPWAKEPYEAQANAAKERYSGELAMYQKTEEYKSYGLYLSEFKAKHGGSTSEEKRPKLERASSGDSESTKSTEITEDFAAGRTHTRLGSVKSMGSSAYSGSFSPVVSSSVQRITQSDMKALRLTNMLPPISPTADISPMTLPQTDPRYYNVYSPPSSTSDESLLMRDPSKAGSRSGPLPLLPSAFTLDNQSGQLKATSISSEATSLSSSERRSAPGRPSRALRHEASSSLSSGSSRSDISLIPPKNAYPTARIDDTRWSQTQTSPVEMSDFGRPLQPALNVLPKGFPFGSIPLPPLIPPERLPDILSDPNPRNLPTLQPSPQQGYHTASRSIPQLSPTIPAPLHALDPAPVSRLTRLLQQESQSPLESSESEAADALAGLAYGNVRR